MKVSKAQRKASAKWDAEHRDKKNKTIAKSKTKKFILEYADDDDIKWIQSLIEERNENNGN